MPQLNPSPWFMIMLFTWSTLLIILVPKIMTHTFPNTPSSQNTQPKKAKAWTWPWY
uniref:ATP synthase complex subunit 8 n=1 Tax=Marilyna darwinii TaxID=303751 RepID=F2EN78_9TELE|nr:ATP synthase F0 subunit 8 [Marilyna darwinii]BAK10046.1 ATPase subunit 8 [Marilyna darwinii]